MPVRPTRAELDLEALRHNLSVVRSLAPKASILGMVKANAYGHGAVPIARALEASGVAMLGVALVEEGLTLREAGVRAPILVLGGAYEGGWKELIAAKLTPMLFEAAQVERLAEAARAAGTRAAYHLKIDSGMGRLGVRPNEVNGFLDAIDATRGAPEAELEGIMSHFASADLENAESTHQQLERFVSVLGALEARGIRPRWRHLGNSAAVMSLPTVRDGGTLNLVRPGLMLYGMSPSRAPTMERAQELRPVLEWKTQTTFVKTVPAGTPISYGGTWVAKRPSTIATLPVGYADGYPRALSNRGEVLVRGRRAPVAGRVCMDMVMIDVTDIPGVREGDEVTLLGRQGDDFVGADALAGWVGTISYEILCGIGARVPRVIREAGSPVR